jgi:hypothetical protein
MLYSKFLFCLWLFLGANLLLAQPADLLKAYQNASKLKIDLARQQLSAYKAQNKKIDGWAIYVEDFTDMVTLLVSDNHQLFDKWVENEDKRLEQLEKLPENNPHTRFFQGEVRLHWAFAKLKFGKEVSLTGF